MVINNLLIEKYWNRWNKENERSGLFMFDYTLKGGIHTVSIRYDGTWYTFGTKVKSVEEMLRIADNFINDRAHERKYGKPKRPVQENTTDQTTHMSNVLEGDNETTTYMLRS